MNTGDSFLNQPVQVLGCSSNFNWLTKSNHTIKKWRSFSKL